MILAGRRHSTLFLALAAALLLPFVSVALGLPTWEATLEPQYMPAIVLAEALIYGVFTMIAVTGAGWQTPIFVASVLTLTRIGLNMIGSLALTSSNPERIFSQSWMLLHVGNPAVTILQVVFILLAAPHLLRGLLPEFEEAAPEYVPPQPLRSVVPIKPEPQTLAPSGGYMQVYSYTELTDNFRKVVGLEGFMLFSDEGLSLWSSFEVGMNEDKAALGAYDMFAAGSDFVNQLRLGELTTLYTETPWHHIFNMHVTRRVGLLLVFTSQAPLAEIVSRLEILRRTAFEFLRSRGEVDEAAG